MFTGIIEEVGLVRCIGATALDIVCPSVRETLALGDSVAVNGACLTVARLRPDGFGCDVMPETWRRTNLGQLASTSPVNLERAVTLQKPLGGHIVQGHVDGVGTVAALFLEGDALLVDISCPQHLQRYLVEKGFIAVDGASLTIVSLLPDGFRVSLVRFTIDHTIFGQWQPGVAVNLEVDILAKYAERLLAPFRESVNVGRDP
ncbi:MAG: riboflavin synthase [Chloroflexi bacterium]|nr:riboflavin synthase [Chloroflexota bacterium]